MTRRRNRQHNDFLHFFTNFLKGSDHLKNRRQLNLVQKSICCMSSSVSTSLVRKLGWFTWSSIAQDWHNRQQIPSVCFSFFPTMASTGRFFQFPLQLPLFSLTFWMPPDPPLSSFPQVLPPKQFPELSLSQDEDEPTKMFSSRRSTN